MIKDINTELSEKIDDLLEFCKENKIPIFVAKWSPNDISKNAGYSHVCFIPPDYPNQRNAPPVDETTTNKFSLFIRAAEGRWRKADKL